MSSGLATIKADAAGIITAITPQERPLILFKEASYRESLRDLPKTPAKHESSRAFHILFRPDLTVGPFMGGSPQDLQQRMDIEIRYVMEAWNDVLERLTLMTASDAGLIAYHLRNSTSWRSPFQNAKPGTPRLDKTATYTWLMTIPFTVSWALRV